ncbi:MAG: hypothetical protein EOP08_03935 [Proteobacteria bacterium]|nr:MAG: hypothetical protein EOP08_03935 [Pseudomonadota bacterium]
MLGTYTRTHRFGHPTEADLLAAVGAGLDDVARRFLETGLSASGTFDALPLEASTAKRREPAGLFGGPEGRTPRTAETGPDWLSTLVLSRRGELALPIEVELRFRDGSRRLRTWDVGPERTTQWREESASELVAVRVDPQRKLLVDSNWENNDLVIGRSTGPKSRHPLLTTTLAALLTEAL